MITKGRMSKLHLKKKRRIAYLLSELTKLEKTIHEDRFHIKIGSLIISFGREV